MVGPNLVIDLLKKMTLFKNCKTRQAKKGQKLFNMLTFNISGYRHNHVPPPGAGSELDDEAREQSEPTTILGDEGWPILQYCAQLSLLLFNISGYRHNHVSPPEAGSVLDDEAREQSEPATILGDEGWPILQYCAQLSLLLFNISGYRHNHVSPPEAGSVLDDEAREQSEPATILGDEGWPILQYCAQLSLLLFNISGYRHNHVSPPEAGSVLDDEAREQSEPTTILGDEGWPILQHGAQLSEERQA